MSSQIENKRLLKPSPTDGANDVPDAFTKIEEKFGRSVCFDTGGARNPTTTQEDADVPPVASATNPDVIQPSARLSTSCQEVKGQDALFEKEYFEEDPE